MREPAGRLVRARLPHHTPSWPPTRTARCTALRVKTLADHGAPTRRPTRRSSRPACSQHLHRLVRPRSGATSRWTASTPTSRRAASPTAARSASPRRCTPSSAWSTCWRTKLDMDPAELRHEELHPARAVPVQVGAGLGVRQRQLSGARCSKAMDMIGYADLRKEQAEKRARGELMGIGISHASPRSSAPGRRTPSTSWASRCSTSAEIRIHPDRQGDRALRHASRRGRATRRPSRRSSPRSWACPSTNIAGRARRHRHRALRPGHLRQPQHADRRRGDGRGRAQDPREGAQDRRAPAGGAAEDDLEWEDYKFQVKGAPEQLEDDEGARLRRLHQPPAGHGGGPGGGATTTIRPT